MRVMPAAFPVAERLPSGVIRDVKAPGLPHENKAIAEEARILELIRTDSPEKD
jgi:hypothetical protein